MDTVALASGGTLFTLLVCSLSLECARPHSRFDLELRPLDRNTSYGIHVGLQVDLVQICAGGTAGSVNYVTQGAFRVASLMRFYGTSNFKVLCRVPSVVRLTGNIDDKALFNLRVSVLGEQLKRDRERPVSMYDILLLLKRISSQKSLGRNVMHHVKAACKGILKTADMKVPADYTLERIGSFVMAAEPYHLLSFSKCPAINIHFIAFVFKPSWKIICEDSDSMQLVLQWVNRGMQMTKAEFISLFNAVAAGESRTELQNQVVGAYRRILSASSEEVRKQAWKCLKDSTRVKTTGSTSSSGPPVALLDERLATVSETICVLPFSSLSLFISLTPSQL